MNLLSSINALLLLVGLLILVLNLGFSAFRVARGHLHAGVFSVVMTLLACVLLAIGLVRMSFPARAGTAPTSPAASSNTGSAGGSAGNVPARLQTAIASGRISPEQQTAIAQGTIPSFGGGNGGNGGGNGAAPGGSGSAQGAPSTPEAASTAGAAATIPARLQTAIASGRVPPEQQTAIAQGTIPAFGRGGGNGGGGGGFGNGAQPGGTPAAGGTTGDGASEVSTQQAAGTPSTPEAASAAGAAATIPARLQTAIASGRVPPEQQTAIAQGTIPAFGRGGGNGGAASTPEAGGTQPANAGAFSGGAAGGGAASGGTNGGNGGTGGNGRGTGGGNGAAGAAQNPQAAADTLADKITVIGALVILVSGLFLYFSERRRTGFEASSSPGLLYLGAGFFALIAAVLIPALPGEFTVARASGQAAIVNQGNPNRILPTRVMAQRSSPTVTNVPSATATELPTLTTVPNTTSTPLFTQVAYAYSDVTTPSACTITAQTTINLRGDPSVQNQAIGRVFAGSLLRVTGRTADKKWWSVISDDGTSKIEGWVSGDFVTLSPACDSAPVIGPTPVGTKVAPTPQPSAASAANAPKATSTPVAPAVNSTPTGGTSNGTAAAAGSSTAATCTVMTTTAASLRPDPSTQKPPLAQVPQGTALTASGKTAASGWWQVAYATGGQTLAGWIGGGAVLAAANCSAVPVVTP